MFHPRKMSSVLVQRRRPLWRLALVWASYQYTWSMSAGNGQNVRSGYTISRASQVSSSVPHCRNMIRSCSRKRIRCVTTITRVISYQEPMNEQNRMAESLVLFESVINSRWFLRTSIILFLNKIDVFKAKLPKVSPCLSLPLSPSPDHSFLQVSLDKYFPEYTGGTDVNKGAKYILWRFMQANRARLNVYPQFVNSLPSSYLKVNQHANAVSPRPPTRLTSD